ncbi:MAG: hypothetical protein R3F59_31130 [Myxococcota bacterium]
MVDRGRERFVGDLDWSRTIGRLSMTGVAALELRGERDPVRLAPSLAEAERQRGTAYAPLRYLCRDPAAAFLRAAPLPEVLFSDWGDHEQLSAVTDRFGRALLFEPPPSPTERPYVLAVNAHGLGGALELVFRYSANLHRRETIQALVDATVAGIHRLAGVP